MADFYKWTRTEGNRRYNRIYKPPLYSDHPEDTGNYNSLGQLVGTMRSISAPAWEDWTGSVPSAQDMQSITAQQAEEFYKSKVWDKVRGDEIKPQILAEMLADMKSSAGYNGIRVFYRSLGMSEKNSIDDEVLNIINTRDTCQLYEGYRLAMLEYYDGLGGYWVEGWNRDMDRYYPKRQCNDPIFESRGGGFFKKAFGAASVEDISIFVIVVVVVVLFRKIL